MTDRGLRRGSARSAAEWFAVMRGPDADALRVSFEDWRKVAANADAYAKIEAAWDESRFLANHPLGRGRDLSRARRKLPPAALLAAGVALLTLLSASLLADQMGWMGSTSRQQSSQTRIAAGKVIRTFRLADGSRVTLDRGAELRVLSTATERRLLLLHGRARFDVAHGDARPFLVDAGEGRVVAHGTVFDVGLEAGAVRVVLLKGSVEVRGRNAGALERDAPRMLAPGQQLVVRAGTIGTPTRTATTSLAWAEPMISFDAAPLAEAVAAFNRSGGQAVRLEGDGLAALRVSGAFRRDDPQGFADALAASFGLDVEPATDGSLLLRAGTLRVPTERSAIAQ